MWVVFLEDPFKTAFWADSEAFALALLLLPKMLIKMMKDKPDISLLRVLCWPSRQWFHILPQFLIYVLSAVEGVRTK